MTRLAEIRNWYAEELQFIMNIDSQEVVKAFATVPREKFLGPGPWEIRSPYVGGKYWKTEDANPARLYHNVLVAIDSERHLNNGMPSLWAYLFDKLEVVKGERIVHIGTGTGYYTAILAELTGENGAVIGIEVDPDLANRSRSNVQDCTNVSVVCANGGEYDFGKSDIVIVNAGVTHPVRNWVESLNEGGRLLIPLTGSSGSGGFLKVAREDNKFTAKFLSSVGIIHCVGSRDEGAAQELDSAFEIGYGIVANTVKSLRYDEHPQVDGCWWHRQEFCLSTESAGSETNSE
jgi:protein-L-isoaspartate(D-aspartate) O-methyltransferase